jgi:hypothetical protein
MGLRPTQGDEKWLLFGRHFPRKHCPPLCHLDQSSEGAWWGLALHLERRSYGPSAHPR